MNIYQNNWKLLDYIEANADVGNENYKRMLDLYNKFLNSDKKRNVMSVDVLCTALFKTGSAPSSAIKSGNIIVSQDQYQKALSRLQFGWEIVNWVNENKIQLHGSLKKLVPALMYCYDYPEIDRYHLLNNIKSYYNTQMRPWTDMYSAIQELSRVYLYNKKTNRQSILELYMKDTSKKTGDQCKLQEELDEEE